ncbi:MAG: GxxExxY protein, partial [Prevotella sp.]|nr:GxxExxY protein [Prevotella sp.]
MSELLYKNESWAIRQAAFEVHKLLGCGFLEKVYQEALAEEFRLRGIPFEREKAIR